MTEYKVILTEQNRINRLIQCLAAAVAYNKTKINFESKRSSLRVKETDFIVDVTGTSIVNEIMFSILFLSVG